MIEPLLQNDDPYSLHQELKNKLLIDELNRLTDFHMKHCEPYDRMLNKMQIKHVADSLEELPFLPVQLFKMASLYSIPQEEHFKVLTSSGTSGQQVSRIFIDRETAQLQSRTLNKIMRSYLGNKRLPMIVIDTNILKDRMQFSARMAGTIGFSQFGRDHIYLFDNDMQINWEQLQIFLEKYQGQPKLLFGFTFIVWEYFLQAIKKDSQKKVDLTESVLIHGGGWKKLQEHAVDNDTFKEQLFDEFRISQVHNYYGMVEQVGSIFMECKMGHLHAPDFADIIIRDRNSLKPVSIGETGLVQVLSILPKSYP